MKVFIVRVVHGFIALYLLACLMYMYHAAITAHYGYLLVVAVISLGIEGFVVFVINKGDCPLVHIKRKIGDDKPFLGLFLPPAVAARTLPAFALITWIGVGMLVLRFLAGLA